MEFQTLPELADQITLDEGDPCPVILRPCGIVFGADACAENVLNLAGGPAGFSNLEIFLVGKNRLSICRAAPDAAADWAARHGLTEQFEAALSRLTEPRAPFAGIPLDRPCIMGIVNITPDSFFAGSRVAVAAAADVARRMIEDGADIIDIGGESTRPGSEPTPVQEELDRVLPVLEKLKGCGAAISVDTRRAVVMRAAIAVGVSIINDVTALSDDGAVDVIAQNPDVSVVLMHAQGAPKTMQDNPHYDHAPYEIFRYLAGRAALCEAAKISRDHIAIDPGFGFGKTVDHNLQILESLALFHGARCAVLAGLSRKAFLGALSDGASAEDRLPATIAASVAAHLQGVQIHRVHDVKPVKQALLLNDWLMRG